MRAALDAGDVRELSLPEGQVHCTAVVGAQAVGQAVLGDAFLADEMVAEGDVDHVDALRLVLIEEEDVLRARAVSHVQVLAVAAIAGLVDHS